MSNLQLPITEGFALTESAAALDAPRFIRQRLRLRPEATALTDAEGDAVLSYGELDHQVGRCAAGLAAAGLKPGDAVLTVSANSPGWVVLTLAAMAMGARVSAVSPTTSKQDLTQQMRNAKACLVFTQPELLDIVRPAAVAGGCERLYVDGHAPGARSLHSLLACTEPEPVVQRSGPSGPADHAAVQHHRDLVSTLGKTLHAASWAADQVHLWPSSPQARFWIL